MQETYIEEILKELTLEEKIGMIHGAGLFRTEGVERLSIPPLYMSDGPMGVPADLRKNIILKKHIPIMRECFQTIPLILFILHHQIVCIIHRQKVL